MIVWYIYVLLCTIHIVYSQSSSSLTGNTIVRSYCAPNQARSKVTRYETTYICINIDNNKRTVINPVADILSSITVPESFHHYFGGLTQKSNPATNSPLPSSTPRTSSPSSSPTSTPRSTTSTSFVTPAGLLPSAIMMDISSYDSHSIDVLDGLKYLYRYLPSSGNNKPSGYYIFPTYTVILHVVQGDLQRITWDETCLCPETITSSSSSAVCLPNTDRMMMNNITTIMNISTTGSGNEIPTSCALPITSCTHQPTKEFPFANSCDLQLFFVWTGTDSNGQFFTSSSKRFSRFRAWPAQLTQLWESIKDTGNRIVDSINPLNRN